MESPTAEPQSTHRVHFVYPALNPFVQTDEFAKEHRKFQTWHYEVPDNVENRYAPAPLVPHPKNRLLDITTSEADYCHIAHAPLQGTPPNGQASKATGSKLTELIEEVNEAMRTFGTTQLLIDTIEVKATLGYLELLLCIERSTTIRQHGGQKIVQRRLFVIRNWKDELTRSKCTEQWFKYVSELIYRKTDRAARHVKERMIQTGEPATATYTWMPQRMPNFERFLPWGLVHTREAKCDSCDAEDFPRPESRPVEVGMCGHWVCRRCLLARFNRFDSPFWLTCPARTTYDNPPPPHVQPTCNRAINFPSIHAQALAFGVYGKHYMPDSRFTDWENWERSCYDLDEYDVQNNTSLIAPEGAVLSHAWNLVVRMARLQPASSVPKELHPVNSKAFQSANNSIVGYLGSLSCGNKQTQRICDVFKTATDEAFDRLAGDFLREDEAANYLTEQEQQSLRQRPQARIDFMMTVPPNLPHFLTDCLRRTLHYYALRFCECKEGHGKKFHDHGGRNYYDRRAVEYPSIKGAFRETMSAGKLSSKYDLVIAKEE